MYRRIFFIVILLGSFNLSFAQSTLWGIGKGGIFEYNPIDSSINERYLFPTNTSEGYIPVGDMMKASNNKIYYKMRLGGNFNEGTINVFDPSSNTNSVVFHFDVNNGEQGYSGYQPRKKLLEGPNNKLYGTTSRGGNNGKGVLYEIDISNNIYTVIHHFDNTIGNPTGTLTLIGNNKLIGVAYYNNIESKLFEFDITNNTITDLVSFPQVYDNDQSIWDDVKPVEGMVLAPDGNYYGLANKPTNNPKCYIYQYNPNTNSISYVHNEDNAGFKGGLFLASDNSFYMYTFYNFDNYEFEYGEITKYDYTTDQFTQLEEFDKRDNYATLTHEYLSLIEFENGRLVGYNYRTPFYDERLIEYNIYAPFFSNYEEVYFPSSSSISEPIGNLVEVEAPPLVSDHPDDFTVCEGTPDSIYVSAIGADSYQWYQEGNAISGATDSILYFNNPTPADDGYYYCELTNTFGTNNSDSALVTVYPLPNVQANASPSVICEGDTLLLVGTGADSYVWDNGVVNGIEFVPTTSEVYTVVGTDGNGCTNSASVNMPLHTIDVSFAEDTVLCGGELLATVNGDGSSYTYNWNPNTDLSCTNCPNPIASPNTVTDYHLTVSDNNGCSDNDSIVVNILAPGIDICVVTVDTTSTKNVLVWEKPVTGAIDYFTVYRDVVGTYQPVVDIPYDSLSQYIDTSAGINPNITQYRYKLSATDTCGVEGEISDYHQTIHLNTPVYNGGVVDLVWQAYEGFPTNYYYRILRDTTGNYNWEVLDSVSSSTLVYTDINPPVSGPLGYIIEIAFDGTCTSTRAVNHNSTRSNRNAISIGNSIEELSSLKTRVYPNPSREGNEMTIENNELTPVLFDLYSIEGKRIDSFTVNGSSKKIIAPPKGVYVLKITGSGKHIDYQRIIIN